MQVKTKEIIFNIDVTIVIECVIINRRINMKVFVLKGYFRLPDDFAESCDMENLGKAFKFMSDYCLNTKEEDTNNVLIDDIAAQPTTDEIWKRFCEVVKDGKRMNLGVGIKEVEYPLEEQKNK